jgi:sugar O-acyltransferase (sialic acid O-acetyltransferase NeuD family)
LARIIIFGAGEISKLAYHYFTNDREHEVIAFTVDKQYKNSNTLHGLPLVDFSNIVSVYPPARYKMFIALSYSNMNKDRAAKYSAAIEKGYELVSYVSTECTFLTEHAIGANCFILEDNTIQPFVKIGNNVTLWSGNHVGHDTIIKDHCFITSHVVISGNVTIHPYVFIGVNATLRNSITIAEETLIGAGATIMHDTGVKEVYISEKAVKLKKRSDEIDL